MAYNPIDPANLYNVHGQIAVVTGGGTGIGLLIATSLENNGATVYIIGRRLDVLEKAARDNNKYGNIIPLQGDITSRDSLLSMVETIRAKHGYIDLLVNNAGISRNILPRHLPSPSDPSAHPKDGRDAPSIKAFQSVLWDTADPQGFADSFDTNVSAVYFATVAFLELLHLGNLRRGLLPPSYASSSQSTFTTTTSQTQTQGQPYSASMCGDLDGGSTHTSLNSTPSSTAYHSLPPTPPSPHSELPPVLEAEPTTSEVSESDASPTPPFHTSPPSNTSATSDSPFSIPTSSSASSHPYLPLPTSQVITISSSGSFRLDARVLSVSYTLAKSACTHLGRLLANLLAEWGVRSNVLAPGVWPSEMTATQHFTPSLLASSTPMGRAGTLTDMAGPILFLASRAGAYVNGAVWLVDGGRVGGVASSY